MIFSADKRTFDTDDGRPNNYPVSAVDVSGRMVIFYEKILLSGRLSDSRVTYASFTVHVEAGNGSLNSTPVSWIATDLTMPANSSQIVYVDSGGTVSFTSSLVFGRYDMSLMATSIILAFVSIGNIEINQLEEVEKTGKYIYARSQIFSGGSWIWDNNEYILNTGEQPKAYYDIAANYIYLSYKKDSISYVRVINFANPLTLRYNSNISIQSGSIITLNNNPQNTFYLNSAGGYEASVSTFTTPKLYLLSYTALKFIPVLSVQQPHIYMPFVTSSGGYLPYLRLPYYIDIFSLSGSTYILEESVAVYDNTSTDPIKDLPLRWHQWTGSLGQKYLGVRAYNTLFVDPYLSDPSDYVPIFVSAAYEGHQTVGNIIYSYVVEKTLDDKIVSSAGYEGTNPVTYQYDILFDLELQSLSVPASAGYNISMPMVDFDLVTSVQQDTFGLAASAGYNSSVVII